MHTKTRISIVILNHAHKDATYYEEHTPRIMYSYIYLDSVPQHILRMLHVSPSITIGLLSN